MRTVKSVLRRNLLFLWLAVAVFPGAIASADDMQRFILTSSGPSDRAVAAVEAMGGKVTYRYQNIDAVAVEVPGDRRMELLAMNGVTGVYRDKTVRSPQPVDLAIVDSTEIQGTISGEEWLDAIQALPQDYASDNLLTGASALHANGILGTDVIVVVIDTGTTNNPAAVPSIAGKVIGGENFVPGAGEPSATSTANGNHGTWVGSTIAADVGFLFSNTSTLVQSLLAHDPGSVLLDFPVPGISVVPMIGSAPGASLYAMKTFAAAGGGAPESRIIAAMDRAITLRRNYNNGMPSVPVAGDGSEDDPFVYDSLNIQVVNMSLGGPTLFAGRDVEDLLTREMLEVGITLVASAGNDGHAAMTGGSAGTGIGSLTVGAASLVNQERILRDLQFGLGIGALWRPSAHHQTADFSSRGPTADGRLDPDLTASGFANFVQGAAGGLSLASGTSFSAPTVAGAAALLREAVPTASATQIRNTLMETADPNVLGDDSGAIDQGEGFIDIPDALSLLQTGTVSEALDFGIAKSSVRRNLQKAGFQVHKCRRSGFSTRYEDLLPGQVEQLFVETRSSTSQVNITVSNITPELPPAQQNALFGDDIFLKVQDAPTSDEADPFGPGALFLNTDTSLAFANPQTGIVRIATMGDTTNAGRISADVRISCVSQSEGEETADGAVAQGETDVLQVRIPAATAEAVFELSWDRHWGRYPTDDLDMVLIDPAGAQRFDGATLASPERVVVSDPSPGTWAVEVSGFTVFGRDDDDEDDDDGGAEWELRVTADGRRLDDDHYDDDDDDDDDEDDDEDDDD